MATVDELKAKNESLKAQFETLRAQHQELISKRDEAYFAAKETVDAVKKAQLSGNLAEAQRLDAIAREQLKEVENLRAQAAPILERSLEISRQQSEVLGQISTAINQEANAAQAADPTSTVKNPDATNPSSTSEETSKKYADNTRVPQPLPKEEVDEFGDIPTVDLTSGQGGGEYSSNGSVSNDSQTGVRTETYTGKSSSVTLYYPDKSSSSEGRISSSIRSQVNGIGAPAKSAQWAGAKDLRATLRVPSSYLVGPAAGPASILRELGGILFPYTPEISYDTQAQYGSVNPVHSNYTQYYYKNSSVGPISVSGKFTVQNEKEGMIFLGIQHLLRSLTKMRFGSDKNAGSPPPVCRLDAYGDYMINNVPVVVASFKVEMPNSVDYISVKTEPYKTSLVPTMATISMTLNPMYSRSEIARFSVDGWLNGNLKNRGYL